MLACIICKISVPVVYGLINSFCLRWERERKENVTHRSGNSSEPPSLENPIHFY